MIQNLNLILNLIDRNMKTPGKILDIKKICCLLFLFCMAGILRAQAIFIPDVNFKNKLLEASPSNQIAQDENGNPMAIDTNQDGEIQESEALAVYQLYVGGAGIEDLTGIEFFTNLTNMGCANNNLTEIDFSSNPNLEFIWVIGNPLAYLNIKNGSAFDGDINVNIWLQMWGELPDNCYICADEGEIPSIEPVLNLEGEGKHISSYCTFYPGGNYNTITGSLIFDTNNDGSCDGLDLPQPFLKIDITDGYDFQSAFTDIDGNYVFYTQAGDFELFPHIENPGYFNVTPGNVSIEFPDADDHVETVNFCVTPNGTHNDLEIVITPIVPARPGFEAVYKLVYRNTGNQPLSQTNGIMLNFDNDHMNFVTASETPSSQSDGILSWNYTDLMPLESRSIEFRMQINAPTNPDFPVNIDDILTFTTHIDPDEIDEDPDDNTFVFNQTVVGAFDPNDIICIEGDLIGIEDVGKELHYAIRFENTGNYQAENVVVTMEIDSEKYDVSSVRLLDTSHTAKARIVGNKLEVFFSQAKIESGGHGNILLMVKTRGDLSEGDFVTSRANIYFDYNYPVTTNDATTFIEQIMSTADAGLNGSVVIYPNPVKDKFTISSEDKIKSVELFDMSGRLISTALINDKKYTGDIHSLNKGIYIIRVYTDKGTIVQKIVKQ